MKLHLPVQLRRLLLVALICPQFEWVFAETQPWPYTEPTPAEVVIAPSEPGVDASVTISTWSEATYVDSIIFESGGEYTLTVVGSDMGGTDDYSDLPGYGVLGDGNTDVSVIGSNSLISDTSVMLVGYTDIDTLTIDGNAVLNIAPGIYMNGNQQHDEAGSEEGGVFQKSYGVKINEIILGRGTLMMDNEQGYLYDNYGMPFDSDETYESSEAAPGYTLTLTHDEACLQMGANARSKWDIINGEHNGSYHNLTVGGEALSFDVNTLSGLKNLTLGGGNFNFQQSTEAIHGDFSIEGQADVVLHSDNIMAQDSGVLSLSGVLDIGATTQTLYSEHALALHGGVIKAAASSDGTIGTLIIANPNATISYEGGLNQIGAAIQDSTALHVGNNTLQFYGGQFSGSSALHGYGVVEDTQSNRLFISGAIVGSGNLVFNGHGMVELSSVSNEFSGNVTVKEDAEISLVHTQALINAQSVSVESGASLYSANNGDPLTLNGSLLLQEGAILHFDTLRPGLQVLENNGTYSMDVDSDKAGILANSFSIGESLTLSFGTQLDAVNTYLILKGNETSSFSAGGNVTLYVNGQQLDASQYIITYAPQTNVLMLTTQIGNVWTGMQDSVWSVENASGGAGNWLNAQGYSDAEAAIFNRTFFDQHPDTTEGRITISGKVSPRGGLYISNNTGQSFTFTGDEEREGSGLENTSITKKGTGSATLSGVKASGISKTTVEGGQLRLEQGSVLETIGEIFVQIVGLLSLEDDSVIYGNGGDCSITNTTGETAALRGVSLVQNEMCGEDGNQGQISNAVVTGYDLNNVSFSGNGELHRVQINDGTEIASGRYKLFGMLTFNSTLLNKGTVSFDESALINIGSLAPKAGTESTYTLISGGVIEGWQNIALERFYYHGVALSQLQQRPVLNLDTDGELDMSLNNIAPTSWDSNWGLSNAPVFGAVYKGSNQYLHHPYDSDQIGSLYTYNNIVEGGSANTTVMLVVQGAGPSANSSSLSVMSGQWGSNDSSAEQPIEHWIIDQGANYRLKVAGAYVGESYANTYYGNSHLYITGESDRTDAQVYGGSYNVKQVGDTWLTIEAGTYDVICGASYQADLEGNVHLYLDGGALNAGTSFDNINSLRAAGIGGNVDGNADIYLSSNFRFLDSAGNNSPLIRIDGSGVSGTSTLHFTDGVRYAHLSGMNVLIPIESVDGSTDFKYPEGESEFNGRYTSVEITGFDRIELTKGTHVSIQSCLFNIDKDITISGHGTIQLVDPRVTPIWNGVPSPFDEKESEQWHVLPTPDRDIIVTNHATLHISTRYVTAWNAAPANRDWILVEDTGTLDMTGWMAGEISSSFLVNVALEGDGADGQGALYKGISENDVDTSSIPQFPIVKLTGNASIGIESGAMPLFLRGANKVYNNTTDGTTNEDAYLGDYDMSSLDLCDDTSKKHYVLTLRGGGILGLDNTTVDGGTINVLNGTLHTVNSPDFQGTHHVTIARTTDIVLHSFGALDTDLNNGATNVAEPLRGGLQTLLIGSLSGEGVVDLSGFGINNMEIVVEKSTFYGEYMNSGNSYWNSNGYGYAVYSGTIHGKEDSTVSKSGTGVQYFTGSSSNYGYSGDEAHFGGTYVSAGTLYLLGTSLFGSEENAFVKGNTIADKGVVGTGDVYWTGYTYNGITNEGRVYLSDGVRILNDGSYYVNTSAGGDSSVEHNMIIGVESQVNGSALSTLLYQDTQMFNRIKCVLVDTEGMKSVAADGYYADGTVYAAGADIDASKGGLYIPSGAIANLGLKAQAYTHSFNGTDYTLIDTHNLSSLSVDGIYLDGSIYKAGDTIDRNRQLYVASANIDNATANGLNLHGYNEATWSGVLSDSSNISSDSGVDESLRHSNLVKEGGGTLTLDQVATFTGYTRVKGGTLNLRGWATLGTTTAGVVTMENGTSLKLSYDASYTDAGYDFAKGEMKAGVVNETEEMSNDMLLSGRGDVRWLNDGEGTDCESAALISDVGAAVTFSISGELTGDGNVLHSGEGKTIISNANSYSLGTTVTRGVVEVQTGSGLGTTSEGGHAMLDTRSGSLVQFTGDAATTVLAADVGGVGSDGVAFEGNSIKGRIEVGTVSGSDTSLVMRGNGYWAEDTQLMSTESSLVFSGEAAANVGSGDGNGAGVIHGSGMLAVSDVDAALDHDEQNRLEVQFAAMNNFSGNITVEGTESILRVTDSVNATSGNVLTGNDIHISGEGATLDLAASDGKTHVKIASGKELAFTSTGAKKDAASAVLKANEVTITPGGTLSVAHDNIHFEFADLETLEKATSFSLSEEVMHTYESDAYVHTHFGDTSRQTVSRYDYHFDESIGLNQTAVATVQSAGLTLESRASYVEKDGHASVGNGVLTLDASQGLIRLEASVNDTDSLVDGARRQLVLFSDVAGISFAGYQVDYGTVEAGRVVSGKDMVYAFAAKDFFYEEAMKNPNVIDPAYTVLVYDAGAGIVYLDTVPEPSSTTMSILMLAALAARRRRK